LTPQYKSLQTALVDNLGDKEFHLVAINNSNNKIIEVHALF
jgi:hypothetical protein